MVVLSDCLWKSNSTSWLSKITNCKKFCLVGKLSAVANHKESLPPNISLTPSLSKSYTALINAVESGNPFNMSELDTVKDIVSLALLISPIVMKVDDPSFAFVDG